MNEELKDKKVLLIGSGEDLNAREMQERIDAEECEWDFVARVNKWYGNAADVGQRTDIAFMFKRVWLNLFLSRSRLSQNLSIVAFQDGTGCGREYLGKDYRAVVAERIGMAKVSTGLTAVYWLLERGATVEIIGFGTGENTSVKTYPDGTVDKNGRYDWAAERAWLEAQEGVKFL